MVLRRICGGALLILPLAAPGGAYAATTAAKHGSRSITDAGEGVAIALPVLAGGIALTKDDWTGVAQLTVETLLTVGTAYGLKHIVHESRPDGSDNESFPSDTTALAASGSSFLWGRYGASYGLPATLATGFVAYSRVQARKHHWYDTLASVAIASGYGYFIITPFRRYGIYTDLTGTPDGAYLHMSYNF